MALFERLGDPHPLEGARSQIREGIPQLQRYLFLRQAWRAVVNEGDSQWIQDQLNTPPDGPGGGIVDALKRALERGVTKQDLTTIVRVMQWRLLFRFCYLLSDPGDLEPEIKHVAWGLFEIDEEGRPVGPLQLLHEDVLRTDPTGREMRPLGG